MKRDTAHVCSVAFLSLSLLCVKCGADKPKGFYTYGDTNNNTLLCREGFMSVYLSKRQFDNLPLTVYVEGDGGRYHQAVVIAQSCHYFIKETENFIIFTAAFHSCFVRANEDSTTLIIVIVTLGDGGKVEIVKSIPLICRRERQVEIKGDNVLTSRQIHCNKDGFNIRISRNASVPPLNVDKVWIPSGQNNRCQPKTSSSDTVTFKFPFTDCGTQSEILNGIITYWVNIEAKKHLQRGSIIREKPFQLKVCCSFTLVGRMQLGIEVKGEKSEHPVTLKDEGVLRAELRFAKDSSYQSFYSSRDPPIVTELGQPVHVEVSVLKIEDKDLVLLLDDCWATATTDPQDQQRWNLLVKGCPYSGDSQRTVVLPVVSSRDLKYPSLHKWFVVQMFSFVTAPESEIQVYFHCNIEICKGTDCTQSCSDGRRGLRGIRAQLTHTVLNVVVSGGPLLFQL